MTPTVRTIWHGPARAYATMAAWRTRQDGDTLANLSFDVRCDRALLDALDGSHEGRPAEVELRIGIVERLPGVCADAVPLQCAEVSERCATGEVKRNRVLETARRLVAELEASDG